MPARVIVIGASAGALGPLKEIMAGLPADLDAAVLVVRHIAADGPALLPQLLAEAAALPVSQAIDGESIRAGQVYVAAPDRHLVVDRDGVHLTRAPKENFSRPAVDPLFRSAAQTYGRKVIGVILSGRLDDGTAGLWAIKRRGGITVVQDPRDAQEPSMPRSAMQYVELDHRLPASEIAALLVSLTRSGPPRSEEAPVSKTLEIESGIARGENALALGVMEMGALTPYTCPECHGVLVALDEGGIPRFRCHTGHAYSLSSLLSEVTTYVENALWNATRSIEEAILLMQHAARHLREQGNRPAAELFASKAQSTEARAQLLRSALNEHEAISLDLVTDDENR
ncbi:MAG TPA: chemotaxis protein CheB [Kofleriaceae bacterium]|nr:chemotaxis protein CheB [Kofleriaceae bacterium]